METLSPSTPDLTSPQKTASLSAEPGLMFIELVKIRPYEHNPRHAPNPEYDRIRDSIRTQGLDQPLVITQRPGQSDYIVHAGGNTRLLVLKELYEETHDSRFARIACQLRPWRRESDVLLAHLRENDLRGSLTFIDKARAVMEAQQLLTQELGLDGMSQRRLETELRMAGYRITQGRISQMEYTVYRLLPLIPLALENGMGRPQIERLRQLDKAAAAVWREKCVEDAGEYEAVFTTLCRRYDGLDWNTELLREALENEIAETAEISIHTVRVLLDAAMAGREVVIPEIEQESEIGSPQIETDKPYGDDEAKTEGLDAPKEPDGDWGSSESLRTTPSGQTSSVADLDHLSEKGDVPDATDLEPIVENRMYPQTSTSDIKSLRGRAWTLAARLAQRNGFGELVEPVSSEGLGYVLRDVPDPALAEQLDEESLSQLSMLWWQLAACAEMTFAPLDSILPLLPDDSILRRALETEDADLLFKNIWTLDPGHTGYRLWRLIDERDWNDLLNLMETYRRIRRLAAESGQTIWE